MSTAYVIATLFGALMAGFSAGSVFFNAKWVVEPLAEYGVPRAWWTWLGIAKAAGAVGLLVGLAVPAIGVAAAIGLVLYFTGAVIAVIRARSYAHIPFPVIYAAPAVAVLALIG
ncbi:DoxX family protein [Streptomyces sp. NPDC051183]|uniref:DoxX family protein n=1 Tax=unclassified Streptomyces TaxID=2593676 RepID=UPI0034322ABB